jgi:hypothetical protein
MARSARQKRRRKKKNSSRDGGKYTHPRTITLQMTGAAIRFARHEVLQTAPAGELNRSAQHQPIQLPSGDRSMRISFLAFVALVLVVPVPSQAQEKNRNPFRNAKVGDYQTYKMTMSLMGMVTEASVKYTVTAKNDKELTWKSVTTLMGKPKAKAKDEPDEKIDLTKHFDPVAFFFRNEKKTEKLGKFKKTTEGKEKIKVGEKSYECNWIAGKLTSSVGDLKSQAEIKLWFSKSVPLSGLVKVEMKGNMVNMRIELTGSGHQK